MTDTTEIAWLAGLLEGEGFFGLNRGKYPVIALEMTDEDIVVKIAAMWDVRVYHHRNTWTARVYGTQAIQWMMTLLTLLGKRRSEKVIKIIKVWREYAYMRAPKGIRTMATCHPDRIVVGHGLCMDCYNRQRKEKKLLESAG